MNRKEKITDEMLLDYLDGTLAGGQQRLVEANLRNPEVSLRLTQLRSLDAMLQNEFAGAKAPEGFRESVMYSVQNLPEKPAVTPGLKTVILLLVAVVTLVGGLMFETNNLPGFTFRIPDFYLSFNFNIIFYGCLLMLFVMAMLLFDKVLIQPFFRR